MTLVDTSAWIESLRHGGNPAVAARVRALLVGGDAAWCPMVRLELWNGARRRPVLVIGQFPGLAKRL